MSASRDRSVVRSSVIPSAKYCCSGSLLRLANGSTTIDRRGATAACEIGGMRRHARCRQIGDGFGAQCIDPHRPSDIFDALLAEILDRVGAACRGFGLAPSARCRSRPAQRGFQASRDIDAVAKDVVILDDDVAEIDPDAEPDPPLVGHIGLAVDHRPLHLGGTAHRVDDAREFRQQAVAGVLDDAAPMLADLRVDELAEMRLEALVRAFLVRAHQARVARHIGGEDCGEAADSGHCSLG